MPRAAVIVLFACALLLAPSVAGAKLVVDASTRYEMVWGRSVAELQASVVDHVFSTAVNTPAAAAMCGALPSVKYTIRQEGPRFSLESWVVRLAIVYHYPKWGNASYAAQPLRDQWARYTAVLKTHEETHGSIARDYAERINKALRSIRPAASRAAIENAVAKVFNDLWAAQRQAQERFDAASTPVRFPLPEDFKAVKP